MSGKPDGWVVDEPKRSVEEPEALPDDVLALPLLQMAYRGKVMLSPQQMRAAIEALPFETPKLTAVATAELNGNSFAELLDRAIDRSERSKRPPPMIDLKPVPTEQQLPAEVLKKPMSKLRRF
jgi:hypothetical protein